MPDLLLYIPNHGYSISDTIFVSWLNANFFVRDEDNDPAIDAHSFKISTDDTDSNIVQFTETITDGFVREIDVDAGVTTITGLEHLEGQFVKVTSGGAVVAAGVVSSGSIPLSKEVFAYAVGKGYESTLVPMDLDIEGTGLTTTKRINRAFVNLFETIGGTVGPDSSRQESTGTGTTLFTGPKTIPIPGGYTRDTDITIKQTDPLPMSILSVSYDLGASAD